MIKWLSDIIRCKICEDYSSARQSLLRGPSALWASHWAFAKMTFKLKAQCKCKLLLVLSTHFTTNISAWRSHSFIQPAREAQNSVLVLCTFYIYYFYSSAWQSLSRGPSSLWASHWAFAKITFKSKAQCKCKLLLVLYTFYN